MRPCGPLAHYDQEEPPLSTWNRRRAGTRRQTISHPRSQALSSPACRYWESNRHSVVLGPSQVQSVLRNDIGYTKSRRRGPPSPFDTCPRPGGQPLGIVAEPATLQEGLQNPPGRSPLLALEVLVRLSLLQRERRAVSLRSAQNDCRSPRRFRASLYRNAVRHLAKGNLVLALLPHQDTDPQM